MNIYIWILILATAMNLYILYQNHKEADKVEALIKNFPDDKAFVRGMVLEILKGICIEAYFKEPIKMDHIKIQLTGDAGELDTEPKN